MIVLERGKMNNLVLFDSLDLSKASNEDFYTTTEIISEQTGNSYKVVSNRVRQYRSKLEAIAPLQWHFESSIAGYNGGGKNRKIYHLNKQQALSFVPLLENTEQVVNFTFALAEAFVNMEKELQARKIERATEKVTTRSLTDAVQDWENKSQHSYSHIRNLLVKLATGCPHTYIKKRDPSNKTSMVDLLTAEELEEYNYFKSLVIPMLAKRGKKSMTYQDISAKLTTLISEAEAS